ncbi:MAG: hypothetical protein ACOCWG_00830, partial [bacterium]
MKGQKIESLQERKQKAQEEMGYAKKLLEETKSKKTNTINTLQVLNRKIALRNAFIEETKHGIDQIQAEIYANEEKIKRLNKELLSVKREYARVIQESYKKRGNYNYLEFILASEDF